MGSNASTGISHRAWDSILLLLLRNGKKLNGMSVAELFFSSLWKWELEQWQVFFSSLAMIGFSATYVKIDDCHLSAICA
jgi:hypothetical protein